ncbi:hypothetical protein S40285_09715 [Stachybotrys chlorohalonatus IBT 40285]|uniref:Uncharacterized protein n=1 Tax=Stachybotrys chlorohalonatus (strain IBT 40285) TaxID=1283841 RepID=A0A084QYP3_STAC4|nr:hypothetical protein S40285_09715 [Stachybotrys chlorohalonata IBT 40285]
MSSQSSSVARSATPEPSV